MFGDCCPECGHLLSKKRRECPFCDWDENIDRYSYSLNLEKNLSYNDPAYNDPGEMRPDQLPGF